MSCRILVGDMRERLKELADNSVDSVVCDPPYHLTSIVKRFSKSPRSNLEQPSDKDLTRINAGQYKRLAKGFMGQQWDGGDVAFQPETWAEVLRVLKPGGHCVAFGSSRAYHRLACAIEDAGFEIRDCIFYLYGSGFPKSHNVSKGIDRIAGAEREVVGERKLTGTARIKGGGGYTVESAAGNYKTADVRDVFPITAPATDAARQWEGWGSALKPACEPCVLARKPLSEKSIAANVLRWGCGGLNIDATRIPHNGEPSGTAVRRTYGFTENTERAVESEARGKIRDRSDHLKKAEPKASDNLGRWPANVCTDGSDEVLAGFPGMSGGQPRDDRGTGGIWGEGNGVPCGPQHGDSGSAARYFYTAKADQAERHAGLDRHEMVSIVGEWENAALNLQLRVDTGQYPPRVIAVSGTPTSSASEWNTWLFGSENEGRSLSGCKFTTETAISSTTIFKTLSFLARSTTSENIAAANFAAGKCGSPAGNAESSTQSVHITSGETAYLPGAAPAPSGTQFTISVSEGRSTHPTVKPVSLMQWLVRLVTPPGGTVLDPFMGSGSTGIACQREQFDFIGCELSPEYAAIAEQRLRHDAGLFADVRAA